MVFGELVQALNDCAEYDARRDNSQFTITVESNEVNKLRGLVQSVVELDKAVEGGENSMVEMYWQRARQNYNDECE